MATASIALGIWARTTAPAKAATAGSRLSRIPNVAAESCRSADDEHGRRRLPQADDEGSAQDRRAASARSTSEESLK
jgi:hypothetical protein